MIDYNDLHKELLKRQSEFYELFKDFSESDLAIYMINMESFPVKEVNWRDFYHLYFKIESSEVPWEGEICRGVELDDFINRINSRSNKIRLLTYFRDNADWFVPERYTCFVGSFEKECARLICAYKHEDEAAMQTENLNVQSLTLNDLNDIVKAINEHQYEDLDPFLKKQIDWFAIDVTELIPKKKLRTFLHLIKDEEACLSVMKFLIKYEDYYFNEGINNLWKKKRDYFTTFEAFTEDVFDTKNPIAAFHDTLSNEIELIESKGEFSTGRIDKLNAENLAIKQKIKDLEKEISRLNNCIDEMTKTSTKQNTKCELLRQENANLKESEKRLKAQINSSFPSLEEIAVYTLESCNSNDVKIIQNMLYALLDTTNNSIKSKITNLKPKPDGLYIDKAQNVHQWQNNRINLK